MLRSGVLARTIRVAGARKVNPGAAAASLERQHLAALQDLAAPDPAWFAPPQRAGEALAPDRAGGTQRLRPFEVRRRVREPEIWIVHVTRQAAWRPPTDRLGGREIEAERRVREPGGFGAYLAGVVHGVLQQVVIKTPRSGGPG